MDDHGLSDEDRRKVAAMVDHFVDILSKRYNVTPGEVVDSVRWVAAHKEAAGRIKQAGWVSVIGVVISAALFAMWEGLRSLLGLRH